MLHSFQCNGWGKKPYRELLDTTSLSELLYIALWPYVQMQCLGGSSWTPQPSKSCSIHSWSRSAFVPKQWALKNTLHNFVTSCSNVMPCRKLLDTTSLLELLKWNTPTVSSHIFPLSLFSLSLFSHISLFFSQSCSNATHLNKFILYYVLYDPPHFQY